MISTAWDVVSQLRRTTFTLLSAGYTSQVETRLMAEQESVGYDSFTIDGMFE